MNRTIQRLKRFGYDEATREAPLTRSVNIHELRIRITANVTIAGGAASGDVVEDGPARLLRQLTVDHDGYKYVNGVSGRNLFMLGRRFHQRVRELTTLANADAQGPTPIAAEIVVSFSPKWAANPYELFIPGAASVTQQLAALLDFETGRTTAASSLGSSALVSGGDRDVTISDFACEVVEVSSVGVRNGAAVLPQYIPVYEQSATAQFTAADAALPYELKQSRRIACQLFAYRNGALRDSQDGISHVVLQASNVRKIDASAAALKGIELSTFEAVPDTELGTVFLMHCDNGRLAQALDPRAFGTNPRYEFTVATPASSPGIIDVVNVELAQRPGVTLGG